MSAMAFVYVCAFTLYTQFEVKASSTNVYTPRFTLSGSVFRLSVPFPHRTQKYSLADIHNNTLTHTHTLFITIARSRHYYPLGMNTSDNDVRLAKVQEYL